MSDTLDTHENFNILYISIFIESRNTESEWEGGIGK